MPLTALSLPRYNPPVPPPEVLVLADDLTGALEVGALFAATGAQALIGIECAPQARVPVIDLESRHLDPAAAQQQVLRFAPPAPLVFLKIDSTMRGPIAAKLDALARLWPARAVFLTPAYPKLGRTVVKGQLLVDGIPLHESAFRLDPTHPASSSDLLQILGPSRAQILDAASDDDLSRIARDLCSRNEPVIVAGSGGLARHLAPGLPIGRSAPAKLPRVLRPLVISGSLHAASAEQLLHAGRWPVLECSRFSDGRDGLAHLVQSALEQLTHEEPERIDTMIVFGGDTARALMRAFRIRLIEPVGEALPGVPVSRIVFEGRPLTLITKAGGFGRPDLLPQLAAVFALQIGETEI